MTIHFELWNDRTNNLIDEFDTIEQALDEVRWRMAVQGEDASRTLSLLQLSASGDVQTVTSGSELLRRAQQLAITGD
jgi:hypothetical protein